MYTVTVKETGRNVLRGDIVVDFRGESAVFLSVERGPELGRSAKVRVERTTADTGTTYRMAYYAEVYGLVVVEGHAYCECGHDEDDHPMLPAGVAAVDPDYNTPCVRCSCRRFR